MAVRFECPRCQTVFTRDRGDDDAFVECPQCGALAMSAGEATGADSDALARNLSSSFDAPTSVTEHPGRGTELDPASATQPPAPPLSSQSSQSSPGEASTPAHERPVVDEANPASGVFAGLLTSGDLAPAATLVVRQPPSGAARTAESSSERSAAVAGGTAAEREHDGDGDGDLGRAGDAAGEAGAPRSDGDDDDAPRPAARKAPAASASKAAARASAGADLDLGLGDEFGDFLLPHTRPAQALSPQKKRPQAPASPSLSSGARASERSAVEALVADKTGNDAAAVGASLSEEAFGALEAAFDTIAATPASRARREGLSDDERAFLQGDASPASSSSSRAPPPRQSVKPPPRPPPRPTDRASPPPRPARPPARPRVAMPADRPRGFTLSDEARERAFLPLKAEPRGAAGSRSRPTTASTLGLRSTAPTSAPSAPPTDGLDGTTAPRARVTTSREASAEGGAEAGAAGRRASSSKPAPRGKPSVMSGLPALVVAGVLVLGVVTGGIAGALLAPAHVARTDPRARAELQLAEGNRFYDAGRFDDALGKYKAAVSIDRAFALAHRAKGAALAKQQRWDEAAEAYNDYLGLEQNAIDAADVREAIARRGLAGNAEGASGASGG